MGIKVKCFQATNGLQNLENEINAWIGPRDVKGITSSEAEVSSDLHTKKQKTIVVIMYKE